MLAKLWCFTIYSPSYDPERNPHAMVTYKVPARTFDAAESAMHKALGDVRFKFAGTE